MLLLCACPQQAGQSGDGAQQPAAGNTPDRDGQSAPEEGNTADGSAAPTEAAPAQMQAPKQLVIIYSGNTHARLRPAGKAEYGNLTGGLPALAAEITAVEQEVVQYNRMRVANNGGDPSAVRVDLDAGMIGEHPFMLLDYGGWFSADLAGNPAPSALMLEAMARLRYTAVALRDWQLLDQQEAAALAGLPAGPTLLNTPGEQPQDVANLQRVVVRDVHGESWGIASLPRLPETDRELYDRYISLLLDECAAELELAGVEYAILLAADQTPSLYRSLATDTRFTAVIGAPAAMSVLAGFSEMPPDGPVMLPHLSDGGTELGRCHLIWEEGSRGPVNVFFERRDVMDSGDPDLPWRSRIEEMAGGG